MVVASTYLLVLVKDSMETRTSDDCEKKQLSQEYKMVSI